MIGKDIKAAERFVNEFRQVIDLATFSEQAQQEFETLARTATDPRFPGALLAFPRHGKRTLYYGIANDAAEWRRLRPLLIAYAGPTLTSFQGWPEPLLARALPAEALLGSGGFHVVARLVPGEQPKVGTFASRSLQRMVAMVLAAPSTTIAAPQSTERLLARFSDCLNGQDFDGAQEVLAQCERELRIDALNLLFLRIRLLSWFNNWAAIVAMPEFGALCHTRRPRAVTAALLEAVFQVRVEQHKDLPTQIDIWKQTVRPEVVGLLQLPLLPGSSLGVITLYGLEALTVSTRNPALEAAVLAHREQIPEIAAAMAKAGRAGDMPAAASPTATESIPAAQQALVQAERSNTLDAISRALQLIEGLNAGDRESLLSSAPFRALWRTLHAETAKAPPASWQEWFACLPDPEFVEALNVLAHAVTEWPAALLQDPVDVAAFEKALQEVPQSSPAMDRLADALPMLVNWTLADPGFPRPGMLPVYDTLLFHLMLGLRRSAVVFESAAVLVRAMLMVGLSESRYKALLEDSLMLTGDAMSKRTVYWLLDMLEETLLNPCPDEEARRGFWYSACARLMQMRSFFSPGQKIVFDQLSTELGWERAGDDVERVRQEANLSQRQQLQSALDGGFVAIYTLTASAGRQAANVLKELAPSVRVEISNDKVASAALKNMAHQADFFVMVAASAKHAATGFIQQERQDKPILYANGRGFSSIIRAIEHEVLGNEV